MQKPQQGECNVYFHRYIDRTPDGDYITILNQNTATTLDFFGNLPEHKHDYRYADDKWSIKEVLMHLIDTERIFTYRALAAIRGDADSPLPSYDENLYAANADVSNRSMTDLLEEFAAVRMATKKLFENITDEQSVLTANVASVNTTARALGYVIPGHVIHHIQVVQERYLLS